jgi:hypothetical protein
MRGPSQPRGQGENEKGPGRSRGPGPRCFRKAGRAGYFRPATFATSSA